MTNDPVTNWKTKQLPDLTGRRYLITGGNSGIGLQAAAHLRYANATVYITSRSAAKGTEAAARLTQIQSAGDVTVLELDLASTDSIHRVNETIRGLSDGLDAVINNAGVMQTPQQQTADGFELQFGNEPPRPLLVELPDLRPDRGPRRPDRASELDSTPFGPASILMIQCLRARTPRPRPTARANWPI